MRHVVLVALSLCALVVVGCHAAESDRETMPPRMDDLDASSIDLTDVPHITSKDRVYGVTVDNIEPLDSIVDSLKSLSQHPTTRVVFDGEEDARHYRAAVERIHEVSDVLGEPVDSFEIRKLTRQAYLDRVSEYLDVLGDVVDIWEIGNEVNGEWLGSSADVRAKVEGAFKLVRERGKATALTLHYNHGCYDQPDHEMFTWVRDNLSSEMRHGLDYVLLSYYEENCEDARPDWNTVFTLVASMFPSSKVGFGECGTTDARRKADYIRRYYGLHVSVPSYIGGYFWWYYAEDMLPSGSPLWSVLNDSL